MKTICTNFGLRVVAVTRDNASAMKKACKLAGYDDVGCGPHTVALCVNELLKRLEVRAVIYWAVFFVRSLMLSRDRRRMGRCHGLGCS